MSVDPTKVATPSATSSTDEDTGKTATVQSTSTKTTPAEVTQGTTPAQSSSNSAPVTSVTTSLDAVARIPKRGEIVDYVLKDGYHPGEKRPLIIVKVWGDTPDALINGQVITDSVNDFITAHPGGSGQFWVTSVECDPTGEKLGTWSFAE